MKNISLRVLGDLALAAFVICGAVLLFIGAADLPPPRFEPLGSAAVPRILGVVLIGLALIVAVRAVWRARDTPDETEPNDASPARGAIVFAALIAYVAALDFGRVPFVPATTLFVMVSGMAMHRVGWRPALVFAALGLVLAAALSWVFATFLYIRFN